MNMRKPLSAGMLIILGLVGCKTVNSVDVSSSGEYNWIKTDSQMSDMAWVRRANKERQGGLLHVQVEIHNTTSNDGTFLYRFVWMNANGFTVETPLTTWERRTILARQTITLDGVAPDSSITDCRVEMKRD